MKKLRWVMDGGFWEVDMSTPVTLEGVARPAPGDPLPLGLSRGAKLSRHKQIDFFQRFMAAPFVPSFSNQNHGLSLQRVLSIPLPFVGDSLFTTLLGQFNVQRFARSLRTNASSQESDSSWLQKVQRCLSDQSLYALSFCSELFLTADDRILVSVEGRGDDEKKPRKRAVLHHEFPQHNLTVEAASPSLFVDQDGHYHEVPFTVSMDLASHSSDSGTSCHFCINHTAGPAKQYGPSASTPASLLSGLCVKCALAFKKSTTIWQSEAQKRKMVQPYDIFLSNPHVSASAILGSVITASFGDSSIRAEVEGESSSFTLRAKRDNAAILADLFASVSLSAQYGNFQRLFLDLTRFNARLDVPSGSKFLDGAIRVGNDLYNSQKPDLYNVQAICPTACISFQQQIAGPFSFRIDSEVVLDFKKEWYISINNPVFAIEHALQVLGSAKAVAWYSPRQKEFMIELRFFES